MILWGVMLSVNSFSSFFSQKKAQAHNRKSIGVIFPAERPQFWGKVIPLITTAIQWIWISHLAHCFGPWLVVMNVKMYESSPVCFLLLFQFPIEPNEQSDQDFVQLPEKKWRFCLTMIQV